MSHRFTFLKSTLPIVFIALLIVITITNGRVNSAPSTSKTVTAIDVYSTVLPIIGVAYPDLVDVNDLTAKAKVLGWTLAPDGNTLLIMLEFFDGGRQQQTCLYTVADQSVTCRSYEPPIRQRDLDEGLVAWSPDGSHLVMHENWALFADDPDLVSLDISSGVGVNVTDDGYDGSFISGGDEVFFVDYAPFWAADSQSLYFFRLARPSDDPWDVQLMNLPLGANEPTLVTDLPPTIEAALFPYPANVALSPDGERLVIVSTNTTNDEIGVNVWLVELTTGSAELWVSHETIYQTIVPAWSENPRIVGRDILWSADGRYVVVALDYMRRSDFGAAYDDLLPLNYLIIDATSGQVRPLVDISQFPDLATYNDLGGFFRYSPILGLFTPDMQFVYATTDSIEGDTRPYTFWSVPLTLDAAPVQLATVDLSVGLLFGTNTLTDRALGVIAPNGMTMVQSTAPPELISAYLLQFAE